MGFLTNILSSAAKVVLTPVAVIKDTVNIVQGEEPNSTKDLLESASDDLKDSLDDLGDGEFL